MLIYLIFLIIIIYCLKIKYNKYKPKPKKYIILNHSNVKNIEADNTIILNYKNNINPIINRKLFN